MYKSSYSVRDKPYNGTVKEKESQTAWNSWRRPKAGELKKTNDIWNEIKEKTEMIK